MSKSTPGVRYAEVYRETSETRIQVVLDLDGGTRQDVQTGIGFFDHMLKLMAFHGQFDLGISCEGDNEIDDHHSIEDCGIVLGKAFQQALSNTVPIVRYASNHTAMDEALSLVAIDVSGRGVLTFNADFKREMLGDMATENIREFFRAFSAHSGITIHIHKIAGENDHHVAEGIFKGFGRAIQSATRRSDRIGSTSTKGKLD